MRLLLTEIQREWGLRFWHILFSVLAFLIMGFIIPTVYYHYFDHKQYITIVQPITYNKKTFKPCEETLSVIHYSSTLDLQVETKIKIYKVTDKGLQQIGKDYNSKTFINKTGDAGKNLVTKGIIPCNFAEGSYFYQGIIIYSVREVQHIYPIISTQIEVKK